MTSRIAYRAAWIFPVDQPPIENGYLEVVAGRISAVRAARVGDNATDLGDVAIIPGLVNAHVHLEFSLVDRPFQPASPFADWICSLVAYRRTTLDAEPATKQAALQAGWREAAASGTTLLGEIATGDWSARPFDGTGPRVIPFLEVIGLRPERFDPQEQRASEFLQQYHRTEIDRIAGLSPHAPYTVAPELLQRLVRLAKQHDSPLAMHVAETRAELELLESGTGELAELLQSLGAWPYGGFSPGQRPLDYLRQLAEAPRALIVHGNYLRDDELDFIAARPHFSVIFCPRTHAYFGHEPHPWQRLLARGGNIAIGTDGRGSNPDVSLWNEMAFLREHFPEVSPRTLLELGTLAGARALGVAHDCGSLTVGKRADLVVCSPWQTSLDRDPYEALFKLGVAMVQSE